MIITVPILQKCRDKKRVKSVSQLKPIISVSEQCALKNTTFNTGKNANNSNTSNTFFIRLQ